MGYSKKSQTFKKAQVSLIKPEFITIFLVYSVYDND